jgi:Na+-transporting NADH:ubiquinone oxidoreductase subunit D
MGYAIILMIVGFIRELFGSGSILGFKVIPQAFYDAGYINNGMMIMPTMALVLVGLIIWIQRSFNKELIEKD